MHRNCDTDEYPYKSYLNVTVQVRLCCRWSLFGIGLQKCSCSQAMQPRWICGAWAASLLRCSEEGE